MKLSCVAYAVFCYLLSHHVSFTISDSVRMTSEATCPDETAFATADPASIRQIVGVSDTRVCSVACATWNQCAVSRYLASSRTCQLGNQVAWLQLWKPAVADSTSSATDCTSLIRPPLPPSPLLSKLLALYNFRFGSENLASANPGAFPAAIATSNAVRKARVGFNLTADLSSYIQADLGGPPLNARLGSSKKVTIFAKVTPAMDELNPYVIFLVQNRSQLIEPKYSVKWSIEFFGAASLVYLDLSNNKYQSVQTASVVRNMFSAAVSFDPSGSGTARFYYNGTWLTTNVSPLSDTFAILGDEVVRIGYDGTFKYSGLVHCIAVASDTLGTSELGQLEEVC